MPRRSTSQAARVAALAVGFALAATGVAEAQTSQVLGRDWEDVVSGPGVKVGEGTVVHPIAGVETGFVNNVFREDGGGLSAGVLRVVGEVSLASLPPERLNDPERSGTERPQFRPWRGSIYQAYDGPFWADQFEDDENVGAPPKLEYRAGMRAFYEEYLSGSKTVRAQRNIGLNATGHLHLFPYETIAFTVDDNLTRDIRPTNFESRGDLDRWINHFRLGVRIQPGGRAIVPELRYHNRLDVFEGNSDFANRIQHILGARVNWWLAQFTHFYADASIGFFSGLGSGDFKQSSMPLRIIVGADTALTEKTAARAHVGFAKGFYSAGTEFTGPLLGAQMSYRYNDFGRITGAYRYDFQDSINANFYSEHVLEARVAQQIKRFVLEGSVAFHLRHYGGVPMELGGGESRDDVIFAVGAEGRYVMREWLALTGQLQFATDQTGFRYDAGGVIDDPSFTRFELFTGVSAAF